MSERVAKVLANCPQGFSEEEQSQARKNIGAVGGVKVMTLEGTYTLEKDSEEFVTIDLTKSQQKQADWNQTDKSEADYIKNKPDLARVATSGSYTDLDDTPAIPSIEGLATEEYVDNAIKGLAPQEQADWATEDPTAVSYIKNKPELSRVATSGSYTDLSDTPAIPSIEGLATEKYVDAAIEGLSPQVQSDWNQTDTTQPDYIKNKPSDIDTKPLVAGEGISFEMTDTEVTVNATNGSVSYSGALGGPDTSPAKMVVDTSANAAKAQYWRMSLENTWGNKGTFYMIPDSVTNGLLYNVAGRFTGLELGNLTINGGALYAPKGFNVYVRDTIWDFSANTQTFTANGSYETQFQTLTPSRRAPSYYANDIPAGSYVILTVTNSPTMKAKVTGGHYGVTTVQKFGIEVKLTDKDVGNVSGETRILCDVETTTDTTDEWQRLNFKGSCAFYTAEEMTINPVIKQESLFASSNSADSCTVKTITGALFIQAIIIQPKT